MTLHYIICILITTVMFGMLMIDIFVSMIFLKGNFLHDKASPIYTIIFYNICVGTLQLITHIFTLLPSIFAKENVFSLYSTGHVVHSVWILGLWYAASYAQIIMAANRVSVFVLPRFNKKLTVRNVKGALAFISILALITSIYTQVLAPCCRLYMEWATYSYNYLPTQQGHNMTLNYSKYLIDMPIEGTVTAFCIISYAVICFYVSRMQRRMNTEAKKQRAEILCCIQCSMACACYSFTWFAVHFFPYLGFTTLEPYAAISIVYMTDCGMNAVIMLVSNEEVRRMVNRLKTSTGMGYSIEPTKSNVLPTSPRLARTDASEIENRQK